MRLMRVAADFDARFEVFVGESDGEAFWKQAFQIASFRGLLNRARVGSVDEITVFQGQVTLVVAGLDLDEALMRQVLDLAVELAEVHVA